MRIGRHFWVMWWAFGIGLWPGEGAEGPAPVHPSDGRYIQEWLILGPFPSRYVKAEFLSEGSAAPTLQPKEGDAAAGPDGGSLIWKRHGSPGKLIDLFQAVGSYENASAYAFCELEADRAGEARIQLLAQEEALLWVNGEQVPLQPSDAWPSLSVRPVLAATVPLRPGRNACLLKVFHRAGSWDFAMRVLPPHRGVVAGKVTDPAGTGLSGAIVQAFQGEQEVARARSDPGGQYRLDLFPAGGSFDLRVTWNNLGGWRWKLPVTEAARQALDLKLEEAVSISGTVLMLDEKTPQSAVPIQAFRARAGGSGDDLEETVLSDDRGAFQFVALRPGRYRLLCHTAEGGMASPAEPNAREGGFQVPENAYRGVNFLAPPVKKGTWVGYSTYDNLPQPNVGSLLPAPTGLLYVGMPNSGGLCVFDGADFDLVNGFEGFEGNSVMALELGRENAVWIGTGGDGLIWFDGSRSRRWNVEHGLAHPAVTCLRLARDGMLWIGTRFGLTRYDGQSFLNYRVEDGLAGNWVWDVIEGRDGTLWIGTNGGVSKWDGERFGNLDPSEEGLDRDVYSLLEARDGAMWFGTAQGAVRLQDGAFFRLSVRHGLLSNRVNDILETPDGRVWFATEKGVSAYHGKTLLNHRKTDGLIHENVAQIVSGPDGSLWFATQDGFSQFHPDRMTLWTGHDGLIDVDGNHIGVTCLEPLENGKLGLGSTVGAFQIEGGNLRRIEALSALAPVHDMHRSADGTLWLGSGDRLWKYDGQTLVPVAERENVSVVKSDAAGRVWFGSRGAGGGAWRLDPASGDVRKFTAADGLPHESIWAIHPLPDGTIWMGSFDGLFRYDGQRFEDVDDRRSLNDLGAQAVWAILRDSQDRLWFGGSRVLARLLGRKIDWVDDRMPFPEPKVWDIAESADGVIWIATGNHGLVGYDGTAFTAIDDRDGLASRNVNSVVIDAEGVIWAGTWSAGVTRYRRGQDPPRVRLVSVQIDDRHYTNLPPRLEVSAGHRVTVACREVDFKTHPRKRQLQYRFYDANREVVESAVTSERFYNWTPPQPGTYELEVRAIDRDLIYSAPERLAFEVIPPWYRNAWIAAPAGGSVLALLFFSAVTGWRYLVHRSSAARLQEQMLRQERLTRESLQASNERLEEAREAAEEARAAAEEAREASELANRAKSIFLANMSHEIRTPLNAILGYAQILQRDLRLDAEQRQAVSTIERSGNHLLALINEILDLSKIESGRMELTEKDFDLQEVIVGTSLMFEPRCLKKGLVWRVEGLPDLPIYVRGDEGKLRQVLINLLGNAVKFTDQGSVTLRVKAAEEHIYRFQVEDTGPGLSPETQAKIFEPFTQGKEGKHKGGTGLGLAIARRHIELMGGELRLESTLGIGSTFRFALELPPAAGEVATKAKRAAGRAVRLEAGFKVRALVVDDIAENRDVLEKLLRDLGVDVTVTDRGGEALTLLQTERFDIAFLDIQMPGITGLEVAERILEKMAPPRAKLVAISASVLSHEQKKYAESGFDGFIPKPFRFEQICHCLEDLLGVKFDYEPELISPAAESPAPDFEPPRVDFPVPQALLERLKRSAAVYSVTEFETDLKELEATGSAGALALSARLRQLSRNVQMDEILKILNQIAPSS